MFILPDKHFKSVKSYCLSDLIGENDNPIGLCYWLDQHHDIHDSNRGIDSTKANFALSVVFAKLQEINVECYNNKYDESAKIEHDARELKKLSNMEALNAMNSIRYQIEVEHVDMDGSKQEALDILDRMIGCLAMSCMNNMSEYKDIGCWEIS